MKDIKIQKPYFLYVGNAYPHKNLERLIKAAHAGHFNLLIASARNVFTKRLGKTVKRLNARKYVKLLGFIKDGGLDKLYKNSIAFISPSLSEGFGIPGLEAMNRGTLVLASDIPVFREIYANNVIYFEPLHTSQIQSAMDRALKIKKNEREKMIKKAKRFSLRYSWAKMAGETLKIYEESCNSI